ncbi:MULTISPECIES: helix-turn-helix domain-containing protein [unclassified Lysinibacillus]|uniref:helix-turn-helix domain-containing protein n=1 Tax=Lysinibacillus TaxID=400634 RepID=UPI0010629974
MKIGDRLKEYRLKKNLTQIEVAKKLNISRQSVSKWENNRTYPDIDNLKILAKIYEVSIDELLY